ncbi:hypothetical protein [Streptomyces sp. NPDC001165]|uniref:hypothetical protein n=1 Tax=Streptomyces sp. NPDC001165 TaxID=3364546 RepID=UPI00367F0124
MRAWVPGGQGGGRLLAFRLTQALDGRDAEVERIEVDDPEQATRPGMTGSPTVLIDRVDPFAVPGAPASLSCRLYRGRTAASKGLRASLTCVALSATRMP